MKKRFIALSAMIALVSFISLNANAAPICPTVETLKTVNFDYTEQDDEGNYFTLARTPSKFETDMYWFAAAAPIKASGKTDALNQGNALLLTLTSPMQTTAMKADDGTGNDMWLCLYPTTTPGTYVFTAALNISDQQTANNASYSVSGSTVKRMFKKQACHIMRSENGKLSMVLCK